MRLHCRILQNVCHESEEDEEGGEESEAQLQGWDSSEEEDRGVPKTDQRTISADPKMNKVAKEVSL